MPSRGGAPAKGFAVPDMSLGSPGTEVYGVDDDTYEIVLLGTARQKAFARCKRIPEPLIAGRSQAALSSSSLFHCPIEARPFILARWLKARWAAATFSDRPDHAFWGAA